MKGNNILNYNANISPLSLVLFLLFYDKKKRYLIKRNISNFIEVSNLQCSTTICNIQLSKIFYIYYYCSRTTTTTLIHVIVLEPQQQLILTLFLWNHNNKFYK